MSDTNLVQQAIDDINENLWILNGKARTRLISWFMAINKAAYDRGYAAAQASWKKD